MSLISKLNDSTSQAILYRQNWIGRLLQEWLNEKGVMTNISEAIIKDILRKVRYQSKRLSLTEYLSLQSFLLSCRVSENSVFQLTEIVEKNEKNHLLLPDKINNFITQLEETKNHRGIILSTIHGMKGLEADHAFLIFCDKNILPKKENSPVNGRKGKKKICFSLP